MLSLRLICSLAITQIALLASVHAIQHHDAYTCDSPIYCEGPILKTVQLARVFADSKTFVDMVSAFLFACFGSAVGTHHQHDIAHRQV